jgi:acyl-CoA synthetase (AMP-forming)/AMP-acid ligase II
MPVYIFLADGESDAVTMTYGELDCQARAIAAQLQARATTGERALLLYPPGLEYIAGFLGCLYAGVVAVPAYPPNPARLARTLPRIQTIVENAGATVALTTEMIRVLAPMVFEQAPDLGALRWLATDGPTNGIEHGWRPPAISGETLAFLQYTSGSTGAPKGVMLSHANLLANEAVIAEAFALTTGDCGVSWLPPYHDMGLIGGILQPIYLGTHCVLMSPVTFLQRPIRWLEAISHYGGTISGGPNFAYDLCARKVTPEQLATLDLSRWSLAFNGAEPVRAETIDRFAATFAACGFRREAFYPCYGLAEATLLVTGADREAPPLVLDVETSGLADNRVLPARGKQATRLVSCGRCYGDLTLAIVDPATQTRCQPDQIGEIWVAGSSIAQGYWQQPDESTSTFQAQIAVTDEKPFLRTGDLGFVRDDALFVTGRLKDLIIIDGRNVYPQDIELTTEQCHPAIRAGCSAAFSVDADGEERLVIAAEVERNFVAAQRRETAEAGPTAAQEVIGAIKRAVSAQHDLRVHAVILLMTGTIPKTSSGKIQRHACRAAYLDRTLEAVG